MPTNAKLPKQNVHCQTALKSAKFDLFGILKWQLVTQN